MLQQYPPGRTATGLGHPSPGRQRRVRRHHPPDPVARCPDRPARIPPATACPRDLHHPRVIPPCWVSDVCAAADEGAPRMIIDCAHYQDGRRRDEGAVPLEEAAARCGQGGFVWLGLFEPGEEEL